MPFVVSRVNKKIENDKKLKIKDSYVEMLERVLGKSRNYIMIDLQDECSLYVRGNVDVPAAYIELNVYGNSTGAGYQELSEEITDLYSKELGIAPENIFINFRDVPGFSIDGAYF